MLDKPVLIENIEHFTLFKGTQNILQNRIHGKPLNNQKFKTEIIQLNNHTNLRLK
jgi:hypothetical protein